MNLALLESHRRNCKDCYQSAVAAMQGGHEQRAAKYAALAKESADFIIANSSDIDERKRYRKFLERIEAVTQPAEDHTAEAETDDKTTTDNNSPRATKGEQKKFPVVSRTGVTFADVIGLAQAKTNIREALYPLRYPTLAKQYKSKPGGFLILFGPPGTGKTSIAKAITTEFDAEMIVVRGSDIFSPYVGETEQNIAALFKQANASKKFTILYFDDGDTIFTKGNSHETYRASSLNELKTQLDGFSGRANTLIVLSCNNPEILDEAIRSRETRMVFVVLPSREDREKIFALELNGVNLNGDVSLSELAEATELYSGRNIHNICDKACKRRFLAVAMAKERGETCGQVSVCMQDLLDALAEVKPDVTGDDIQKYEQIAERLSK